MKTRLLILLSLMLAAASGLYAQAPARGAWKTYTDKAHGISFTHPRDFIMNTDTPDPLFIVEIMPKSIPDRYRGSYMFHITRSDHPAAECGSAARPDFEEQPPPKGLAKTRKVAGFTMHLYSFGDAGAGQYYYTYGYRGIVKGKCWEIDAEEHTSPAGNYDRKTIPIDTRMIEATYLKFLASFKFIG